MNVNSPCLIRLCATERTGLKERDEEWFSLRKYIYHHSDITNQETVSIVALFYLKNKSRLFIIWTCETKEAVFNHVFYCFTRTYCKKAIEYFPLHFYTPKICVFVKNWRVSAFAEKCNTDESLVNIINVNI